MNFFAFLELGFIYAVPALENLFLLAVSILKGDQSYVHINNAIHAMQCVLRYIQDASLF
jgi:hypothetical protein